MDALSGSSLPWMRMPQGTCIIFSLHYTSMCEYSRFEIHILFCARENEQRM